MKIYADNAATTKMSKTALDAMLPCLTEIYGNPSSLHSVGQIAKEYLEKARNDVAECIAAEPDRIYFTSGGSEADNQAIISAASFGARRGKKHIISSKFEHHAVLHTLEKLKKEGFEITLVDVYREGLVRTEDIAAAIRPDTALVTTMYANNEIGTIQPVKEIGALCKSKGIIFHTDAVQAAPHLHIDVSEQNIDMLSISAHKFNGPKGVGFLYSRKGIPLINVIEGGAQERGKRAGTENIPGIVGMAAAFKETVSEIDKRNEYVSKLSQILIDGLKKIPHSTLNGKRDQRLAGTINFCFEGIEGESLLLLLDDKGIYASSGSACTSGSLDPSHVLLSLGIPHEVAHGSLRLSINEENTVEEMKYMIKSIEEVVSYLRNVSPVWEELENGTREHII